MRRTVTLGISVLILASGCGLKAPEVPLKKRSENQFSALGMPEICTESFECGVVKVNLKPAGEDDHWIYWKAGSTAMVERPDESFTRSLSWDMRITKQIPLVGSNGGHTALEEGGGAAAQAAFAVMPDPPGSLVPSSVAEVQGFQFVTDRYEGLDFGGVKLGAEFQNPLVNAIGPGLLKSYNIKNHSVELSFRIFILKSADGASHYAVRFKSYSRSEGYLIFDWRKLK